MGAPAALHPLDTALLTRSKPGHGARAPRSRRRDAARPGSGGDLAEQAKTRRALEEAIRTLRPVDRQIVRMRFMEGMSTEEVAAATGLSVAATKTRLHRARAALRDVLAGDARAPAMA
jgi:RNA polymerase sigma-70 factor (ECF subfamily)